jgi:putative peptidoglycan lipid II flippase
MGNLRLRFNWRIPGLKDVMKLMAPATFSSGMLQINVYTDLYFASFIPMAAAAMRYGNLIVLTPLGIISNTILVPLFPVFSRLTAPENWPELKIRIRQGLLLSALTMLPLTSIFVSLSVPIVKAIYQRGAFNQEASNVVAPVLMAYGFGMFFYLARDVLVRVFYALGDGETPFRISIINIFLNGVLDWLLVTPFKTPGLIFATISVNIISMIVFLWILHRRLHGLPLGEWSLSLLMLTGISAIAGLSSWGVSSCWDQWIGSGNFLLLILQVSLSMLVAFGIFALLVTRLKLPEVDILVSRLLQKFGKRGSS